MGTYIDEKVTMMIVDFKHINPKRPRAISKRSDWDNFILEKANMAKLFGEFEAVLISKTIADYSSIYFSPRLPLKEQGNLSIEVFDCDLPEIVKFYSSFSLSYKNIMWFKGFGVCALLQLLLGEEELKHRFNHATVEKMGLPDIHTVAKEFKAYIDYSYQVDDEADRIIISPDGRILFGEQNVNSSNKDFGKKVLAEFVYEDYEQYKVITDTNII